MKYSKYLKKHPFRVRRTGEAINSSFLFAQHNPDRFEKWKALHIGPGSRVLEIEFSPHVRFLREVLDKGADAVLSTIGDSAYYRMHRSYGKTRSWTMAKVKGFIKLLDSVQRQGIKEPVQVLLTPGAPTSLIPPEGYEIYEGHYRSAVGCVLNMEILCDIGVL